MVMAGLGLLPWQETVVAVVASVASTAVVSMVAAEISLERCCWVA
jgi:hypothetical protein